MDTDVFLTDQARNDSITTPCPSIQKNQSIFNLNIFKLIKQV
jgi:hypothetical protein